MLIFSKEQLCILSVVCGFYTFNIAYYNIYVDLSFVLVPSQSLSLSRLIESERKLLIFVLFSIKTLNNIVNFIIIGYLKILVISISNNPNNVCQVNRTFLFKNNIYIIISYYIRHSAVLLALNFFP